jgi:hypothetical protein
VTSPATIWVLRAHCDLFPLDGTALGHFGATVSEAHAVAEGVGPAGLARVQRAVRGELEDVERKVKAIQQKLDRPRTYERQRDRLREELTLVQIGRSSRAFKKPRE